MWIVNDADAKKTAREASGGFLAASLLKDHMIHIYNKKEPTAGLYKKNFVPSATVNFNLSFFLMERFRCFSISE